MGREVRRVPFDWTHPTDEAGRHTPLFADQMPDWDDPADLYYMMYETCSEGTPISPAFKTPEELARWLADNEASAFADQTATYEQWLSMIRGPGSSCSAVLTRERGLESGVAAQHRYKPNA